MFSDDSADRILPPTERRRREARQKGIVARSPEITASALLVMSSGTFWYLAPYWLNSLSALMRASLTAPVATSLTPASVAEMSRTIAWMLAQLAGPIVLVALGGAVASNLVQAGWIWMPTELSPRIRWGFGTPLQRIAQMGWRMLQTVALGLVCWRFWHVHKSVIAGIGQGELISLLVVPSRLLGELCFQLSLAMSFMAICDYLARFWRHEQNLKMTIEERRREMEEEAVDPRLRQRQQQAAPTRPLSDIERV